MKFVSLATIITNLIIFLEFSHDSVRSDDTNQTKSLSTSVITTTTTTSYAKDATTITQEPSYAETGRRITRILSEFFERGYDKRIRPNYGGPPVDVNVTMHIISISSISEVSMDFTADFYFRQTWTDGRLTFDHSDGIKTLHLGAEISSRIWLPDTFFGNEKLAYFHAATTPNVFVRITSNGNVYRSIRLTVTSSCPMALQYFPMDRQKCTIEVESYGYSVKDILYRWAREYAVTRDRTISLPQFDVSKVLQKYRLEELTSGTYSRLVAEIHFKRRMGYYLIQMYIPSSLIVIISWVSFWLHRNASPARVQLGVTTVLTMTTIMSTTNAHLPKISYIKSIDVFLGTCFVMVFAALLEYATVSYLGKRIAMRHIKASQKLSQSLANRIQCCCPNLSHHQEIDKSMEQVPSSKHQSSDMNNNLKSTHPINLGSSSELNASSGSKTKETPKDTFIDIDYIEKHAQADLSSSDLEKSRHPRRTYPITTTSQQQPPPPSTTTSSGQKFKCPLNEYFDPRSVHYNPKLTYTKEQLRRLNSIFGIRPSNIDKYSRIIFPVCFICFQLVYWLVYLHIMPTYSANIDDIESSR